MTTQAVADHIGQMLRDNAISRALVIDDSLHEQEGVVTLASWLEVLEILGREHIAVVDVLRELFTDNGHSDISIEPPSELLGRIRDIVEGTGSIAATDLMRGSNSDEPELNLIIDHLQKLNIEIVKLRSTENAPPDAQLIFLDFTINEAPEAAGTAATQFLKTLIERTEAGGSAPAVFLMSRNAPPRKEWEGVADVSGYLRFCFRYRDKAELASSLDVFLFHLEELLEAWPLGQQYLKHLSTIDRSLREAINTVTRDLMRLTPADFSSFARIKLRDKDGSRGARHLQYLITELLRSEIFCNSNVNESVLAFGATLAKSELRHTDHESIALHDLQGRILYQCSVATTTGPLSFGDIFREGKNEANRYFLVLTPECDLELREDGNLKAENILLLEGQPVSQPGDEDFKEYTPLMRETPDSPCRWMCWNLRKPHAIPYELLMDQSRSGLSRWGRICREHGERLQQRFASDLLEVGTEEFIEGTWQHEVRVFGGAAGTTDKGTITIVEICVSNKRLWSLSGDANLLFKERNRELLVPAVVKQLQVFTPIAKFIETCKASRVFVVSKEGRFAFVWLRGGAIAQWAAPAGWEGSTEVQS